MIIGFCNICEREIDERTRNIKIVDDKGKFKTKLLLNRFCPECWEEIKGYLVDSGFFKKKISGD